MEQNDDIKVLIDTFRGYRDLLSPIQSSLHEIVDTYDSMKDDLNRLDFAFDGSVHTKLDQIYETLSAQAQRSTDLSSRIDQFVKSSNRYTSEVTNFVALFEKIEQRMTTVNDLENQAREQIKKLDSIIEEKKINYNLRDLQRTLENYNNNVQRVSDFINKDVAEVLAENNRRIESIRLGNEAMARKLEEEHSSIEQLTATFRGSMDLLTKIAERGDVNEEYLFDILDKWATSRGVKVKK